MNRTSAISAAIVGLFTLAAACSSTTNTEGGSAGTAGVAGGSGSGQGGGEAGGAGSAGIAGTGGVAGNAGSVATAGTAGIAGEAGIGGTAGAATATWCDSQAKPVGISASDYRCVDFDSGLPDTAVWTPSLQTGTMALTTTEAKSAPNSLHFDCAEGQGAVLSTDLVGGSTVTAVTVTTEFSPLSWPALPPPWGLGAEVLCVEVGGSRDCLMLEHGGSGDRLYVETTQCGVANKAQCDITVMPQAGDWTQIEFAVSAGGVFVALNSISVLNSCAAAFCNGTAANVSIGLNGPGSSGYGMSLDNVQVAVQR
jgi:hypothetical protein